MKIRRVQPSTVLQKKLRVAAYARVSVDTLHHSLAAQVSYYSALIQNNPAWEYAGVYADEGITGTSTTHRDEFKRLIADCNAGKIDLVLVKSISRFARDTVDCLHTVRRLKEKGIAVRFERENIDSTSEDGELLLTLLASFAQEESRSIGDNIRWGVRRRFAEGIPNGHKAPYGYTWDGEMFRIVPAEGKVVKEIYRRYLAGESAYAIANSLAEHGIMGRQGRPIEQTTVKDILSNCSYTGTMALQKNYITEGHIRKRNKGELPMYLVEGTFEPLVSKTDFDKAQEIRKRRAERAVNRNPVLPFSGMVKCGCCGGGFSRRTAGKYRRWGCNTRERKGRESCGSRPIKEEELVAAVRTVMQKDEFDAAELRRKVSKIVIHNDCVEFHLTNGRIKKTARIYNGQRGSNPFTNKVYCASCDSKCERDTWTKRTKVWSCSQPRTKCRLKRLPESELKEAAESLFGDGYEGKIVQNVEWIAISDDEVIFHLKEGGAYRWQRQ
ncbi:resolvase [Selenomonas sp. oral taxon 920]|uniref:recombinase family protein n=1 Tax=Selenomonas sp. oral taxon 920 TaxID=1884263 RepID=UPI000840DF60|nr:recombinase family protein [Selenomonas sp. oral taxon 920]AOH48088.1 resolvase [Selenomonas sp. oral taxon 920]